MAHYVNHRPKIKSGDPLFWSVNGCKNLNDFISQIIRFGTRSEYVHGGIAWVVGSRVFVIEAVPPEVRDYPLSKLLPFYHASMPSKGTYQGKEFTFNFHDSESHNNLESLNELEIISSETELTYLLSRIGEEYSRWQAFISAFRKPTPDNQWQCIELMNSFYAKFAIDFGDIWTPSHMVEAIESIVDENGNSPSFQLVTA